MVLIFQQTGMVLTYGSYCKVLVKRTGIRKATTSSASIELLGRMYLKITWIIGLRKTRMHTSQD